MGTAKDLSRLSVCEAALAYSKRKWPVLPLHSVINGRCTCGAGTCKSPGKHPVLRGGSKNASIESTLVERWFSGEVPRNVAIATGAPSGLLILDVDPRHDGERSLDLLEAKLGPLPTSHLVSTGGGGSHYYFSVYGVAIRNSAGTLGAGLDVRGDGGYVVAPPSQHTSGNIYRWLSKETELSAPPPVPSAALQALLGLKLDRLTSFEANASPIAEGGRNSALMSLAGGLRRKGFDEAEIIRALIKGNSERCRPPLPVVEVLEICSSVMRYAPAPSGKSGPSASIGNIERSRLTASIPSASAKALAQVGTADGTPLVSDRELWPSPVEGAELLDAIVARFKRHIALPNSHLEAMVLWATFTHAHDAFTTSPILALISPDRRCGKTTALALLRRLVSRPLAASNITPAAVFRAVDRWRPTLLIDEADTFIEGSEELRGILNSGHQRDMAAVIRSVGEQHEPRSFSTWCPKVIAKIGSLSDTLGDRAVIIPMKRKRVSDSTQQFDAKNDLEWSKLASQMARWAADNFGIFRDAKPPIPAMLHDRARDNWRPLLAIGAAAGPRWQQASFDCATHLMSLLDPEDTESSRTLLLADIRDVLARRQVSRITSRDLCAALSEMDDRPWPEWQGSRPLSPRQLATLLRPFGVAPKSTRFPNFGTPKGYEIDQFTDAFSRYLNAEAATPQQSPTGLQSEVDDLSAGRHDNEVRSGVAVLRNLAPDLDHASGAGR